MNSDIDFLESISANCNPRYSLSSSPPTATAKGFSAQYNSTGNEIGIQQAYPKYLEPRASIDVIGQLHSDVGDDSEAMNTSNKQTGILGKCFRVKVAERIKKCIRGFILTLLIAASWVGTLHLLKLTYFGHTRSNFPEYLGTATSSPSSPISRNDLLDTTLSDDEDDFEEKLFNDSSIRVPITGGSSSATSIKTFSSSSSSSSSGNVFPFDAPFFMSWYCSIWSVLSLPIYCIARLCCFFKKEKLTTRNVFMETVRHMMDLGMTPWQYFVRCSFFSFMWMITNFLLVYTLRTLDATVVMSLYACTITLVYLLSWVVLHQQFVGIRIVAVIICDTGVALLAYMDGTNSKSLGAVVLAAAAAIASAIYRVLYQRIIGYVSYGEMSLFFSIIGFLTALLMWPMVLLLHFTGSEVIHWQSIPWLPLSSAAGLNLTAHLLSYFGTNWTYEIFLSLGILLAIPICAGIDASVYHVEFKDMKLGGVVLIMLGFLVVLLPDNWNQYLADILRRRLAKWKQEKQMKQNGSRVQDTTTAQLSRLRTPSGRVK